MNILRVSFCSLFFISSGGGGGGAGGYCALGQLNLWTALPTLTAAQCRQLPTCCPPATTSLPPAHCSALRSTQTFACSVELLFVGLSVDWLNYCYCCYCCCCCGCSDFGLVLLYGAMERRLVVTGSAALCRFLVFLVVSFNLLLFRFTQTKRLGFSRPNVDLKSTSSGLG